jgi:hypothetical protein
MIMNVFMCGEWNVKIENWCELIWMVINFFFGSNKFLVLKNIMNFDLSS